MSTNFIGKDELEYFASAEKEKMDAAYASKDSVPAFIGTRAKWDALPQSEKDKYDGKIVRITDDNISNVCSSIEECQNSSNENDVAGASVIEEVVSSMGGDAIEKINETLSYIEDSCNIFTKDMFEKGHWYGGENYSYADFVRLKKAYMIKAGTYHYEFNGGYGVALVNSSNGAYDYKSGSGDVTYAEDRLMYFDKSGLSMNDIDTILSVNKMYRKDAIGYITTKISDVYNRGFASRNLLNLSDKSGTSGFVYNIEECDLPIGQGVFSFETNLAEGGYDFILRNADNQIIFESEKSLHSGRMVIPVTLTEKAKYVSLYINRNYNVSNVQYELGIEVTPYQPYAKSNVEIAKELDEKINNYVYVEGVSTNTLIKTGFYWLKGCTDNPATDGTGYLIVQQSQYTNYQSQIFIIPDNRIYTRVNNYGTWSAWKKIVTEAYFTITEKVKFERISNVETKLFLPCYKADKINFVRGAFWGEGSTQPSFDSDLRVISSIENKTSAGCEMHFTGDLGYSMSSFVSGDYVYVGLVGYYS